MLSCLPYGYACYERIYMESNGLAVHFFLCANQCCFAFLSGYACYERMIHKHPFPSLKNSHVGNWYVITNSHPREFIYTSSFGEQLFMH